MVLYVTETTPTSTAPPDRPTIASMEARARAILRSRGIDPDGLADQGEIAADLGVPRASVSYLRWQYRGRDGIRGTDLEPFPAPAKFVGGGGGGGPHGGQTGAPVWFPRWEPLAWNLTRPQAARQYDGEGGES